MRGTNSNSRPTSALLGARGSEVTRLQRSLLAKINPYYPVGADPVSLRPSLKRAFMDCPRHRFLRRFRFRSDDTVHELNRATRRTLLPKLYQDAIQVYAGPNDDPLPATNSEPGFVMALLEMLDLKQGNAVLEIGAGGGWLSAVMARAVGPRGRVTGIELLDSLTRQARQSLRSLGREVDLRNVQIVGGNGLDGAAAEAPYDRVMVTAGSRGFPDVLFEQVREGGKVVIPLSQKGYGEEVYVLQRDGDHFRSKWACSASFVPLKGDSGVADDFFQVALKKSSLWRLLKDRPCLVQPFPLGGYGGRDALPRSYRFRSYLAKTEPGYEVMKRPVAKRAPRAHEGDCFGILDDKRQSIAICDESSLRGYGSPAAAQRLLAAYRRWTREFMPASTRFRLDVYRAGTAPTASKRQLLERRGGCDFLWTQPALETVASPNGSGTS